MNFFRHSSIRYLSICALLSGFAPFLASGMLNAKSPEYVSSWLQGFAGENHYDAAKEKISRLNELRDHPDRIIKHASKIISENSDLFALPSDNPEPSDEEVFNLLMQEWNRHHQTGSMDQGLLFERQAKALLFDSLKGLKTAEHENKPGFGHNNQVHSEFIQGDDYRLQPLAGGISINAP